MWPLIGQSDVTDVSQKIQESIIELEREFETGELSRRLAAGRFEEALGPQLYATYGKLAGSVPGPLHHLRVDAVGALLAQLENDLQPHQVARAEVHVSPEANSGTTEPETDPRSTLRYNIFDASFDGTLSTALRFDQMLDARFWRTGFTFETSDLCDAFAQAVVRTATGRLASELLSLQRIIEKFKPTGFNQEIKIVPYPEQRRFEHLMLDILNEDERRAKVAMLEEDFLEKTDLRVQYPELNRKRGARVQVTSIIAPQEHKTKLQAIKLADEFVFLSPLSLAEFVGSVHAHSQVAENSGTSPLALAPLWDCLEAKPADVAQLASELKRIMFRALTGSPGSPLGPMMRVPGPIRQLTRLFVETYAIASTNRLRMRLAANSKILATSGDDAAGD